MWFLPNSCANWDLPRFCCCRNTLQVLSLPEGVGGRQRCGDSGFSGLNCLYKTLKLSLLSVFTAQLLHGALAIGSAVIHLYLSLVHRFCAVVVRTALPLWPLLTLGFFCECSGSYTVGLSLLWMLPLFFFILKSESGAPKSLGVPPLFWHQWSPPCCSELCNGMSNQTLNKPVQVKQCCPRRKKPSELLFSLFS